MEILPRTDLNFDKLADDVSGGFYEDGTPLNEGVIKVAKDLQLNPEQTRRLVERTNTLATVKLVKTAKDKKAEIKLADFEEVRQVTHPSRPKETVKTASDQGDVPRSFPNLRAAERFRGIQFPTLEKKASAPAENHLSTIFQEEKRIQELTRQKLATELQVQDSLDYIISEFSKWQTPDFQKFACEAITLHGEIAAPALTKIAEYIGEPADFEKVAYAIDDSQILLEKVGNIVSGLNSVITTNHSLLEARNNLDTTWKKAKGQE